MERKKRYLIDNSIETVIESERDNRGGRFSLLLSNYIQIWFLGLKKKKERMRYRSTKPR
jgi:hypothetical protein